MGMSSLSHNSSAMPPLAGGRLAPAPPLAGGDINMKGGGSSFKFKGSLKHQARKSKHKLRRTAITHAEAANDKAHQRLQALVKRSRNSMRKRIHRFFGNMGEDQHV